MPCSITGRTSTTPLLSTSAIATAPIRPDPVPEMVRLEEVGELGRGLDRTRASYLEGDTAGEEYDDHHDESGEQPHENFAERPVGATVMTLPPSNAPEDQGTVQMRRRPGVETIGKMTKVIRPTNEQTGSW